MKKILNNKTGFFLFGIFLFGLGCLTSCKDDDGDIKFVDLRYNPEDSYTVSAVNPEDVVFEVKSNYPWEILGTQDWYTITPSNGLQDSIYKIVIKAKENTGLDDRIDTLTIKSDYWVGRRFEFIQKGTAWLETNFDTIPMSQGIGNCTFEVKSNQDWACEVTQGTDWLSITSGEKGSMDGMVSLTLKENKGELRYGIITVYDRHHVEAKKVCIEQNGVLLQIKEAATNALYMQQDINLIVESNTRWKITKSEYDVWYSIEGEGEFEGNATVVLHLTEDSGISMRRSEITLTTVSDEEGVSPVVRTLILKQANMPEPVTSAFSSYGWSDVGNGSSLQFNGKGMICSGSKARRVFNPGSIMGAHLFRISRMDAGSSPHHYVQVGGLEFRFHINVDTKQVEISETGDTKTVVYDRDGNVIIDGAGNLVHYFSIDDVTQPHNVIVILSDVDGKMKIEFAIDDLYSPMAYAYLSVAATSNPQFYVGGQPGYCEYEWYGYIAPIDWDE